MINRVVILSSLALLASAAFVSPAAALTMKECSVKYQAAKADGSAKDVKWNDYRAKFCGSDAAAESAADDKQVAATTDKEPEKATIKAPKSVVFPSAVDKKYSSGLTARPA